MPAFASKAARTRGAALQFDCIVTAKAALRAARKAKGRSFAGTKCRLGVCWEEANAWEGISLQLPSISDQSPTNSLGCLRLLRKIEHDAQSLGVRLIARALRYGDAL
jgi:hypothetical protein